MDQALDSRFQLDERAVVGQADDLAADLGSRLVLVGHQIPRIRELLLVPQRNFLVVRVVLEDHDFDLVADVEHLRGVNDAPPRHVGDVEQAVHTAQIHKDSVVGDVLDAADDERAFLENLEGLFALFLTLGFQQHPPGKHDVAALAVVLEDLEFQALPQELVEVAHGPQIHLRSRQERLDADVHLHAALDAGDDGAVDGALLLKDFADSLPGPEFFGFALGNNGDAVVVLQCLDEDLKDFADVGLQHSFLIQEL